MPYVTVGEENSGSIDLYYEDHGSGPPVVVQGDSDQAVPFGQTGQRVPSAVHRRAPSLTETHKLGAAKGR
jgi:hypothetical protein